MPMLLGEGHTFDIKSSKGVGRIPRGLKPKSDASKRILLDQLPKLLAGYGKSYQNYAAVVIVVCDLDDKDLKSFRNDLFAVLNHCNPKPNADFCIAIEEGEAWLLGDKDAVLSAYPNAKQSVLNSYEYDAICGTWEKLADALYPGGATKLKKKGWRETGRIKNEWADRISPEISLDENQSPSFQYFLGRIRHFMQD